MKNKNGLIGLAVGMIAYFIVSGALSSFFEKPSFDKVLMASANEINKNCPLMVDRETRLDNSIALPENKFQYNYTLINLLKDSIDLMVAEDGIKKQLIVNVKETPELEPFRKNETVMCYSYKDRQGVFLFKIEIAPEDYN
ncbi:MAG: hypothetical protein ACI8YQ_003553 [Polaribacter sp.]|jgi:hypothetical protein